MIAAVVLMLALAFQSAPAQQNDRRTWYQAYADAQRAIQDRNWQKAIADLNVAAQRGAPRPGRNVLFYGDVYRDYVPDYYLGIAYTNLQRFTEADQAFERVRQAQLIGTRDALYQEFTRQSTSVKDILQKTAAAAPANAAARPPTTAPPSVAQTAPNTNNQNTAAAAVAPIARGSAQNAPSSAAQTRPADPKVAQGPPPVSAPRLPPITRVQPPTGNRTNPGPVQSPVYLDERAGVLQFFSGDYEAAAASLAAVTYVPGASSRAYFYLACSRAALVLTGKAPRSALDDARAQLASARDTGQFAADKRLISPRIKVELGMQP